MAGLSERRAGAEKYELLKTRSGLVEKGVGKEGGEDLGWRKDPGSVGRALRSERCVETNARGCTGTVVGNAQD